jgi:hypothetical protein
MEGYKRCIVFLTNPDFPDPVGPVVNITNGSLLSILRGRDIVRRMGEISKLYLGVCDIFLLKFV